MSVYNLPVRSMDTSVYEQVLETVVGKGPSIERADVYKMRLIRSVLLIFSTRKDVSIFVQWKFCMEISCNGTSSSSFVVLCWRKKKHLPHCFTKFVSFSFKSKSCLFSLLLVYLWSFSFSVLFPSPMLLLCIWFQRGRFVCAYVYLCVWICTTFHLNCWCCLNIGEIIT